MRAGIVLERRLWFVSGACLWLLAAVACLSVAMQNIVWLGMAAWLLLVFRQQAKLPRLGWFGVLWLLGGSWALAASLRGVDSAHSLKTWSKLFLVGIAFYTASAVRTRRQLETMLRVLFFFGAVWCLLAAIRVVVNPGEAFLNGMSWPELLFRWLNDNRWRARSGSGGYMVLASSSMLLLCVGAGLAVQDKRWRSRGHLLALICIALALSLTLTRSAWLGAAAGLFLIAALSRPKILLLTLLGTGAFIWIFPNSMPVQRVALAFDLNRSDSTQERIYLAEAGGNIVRENPWFGVGDSLRYKKNGTETLLEGYKTDAHQNWEKTKGISKKEQGHLHNNVLQLAVMYGIPGALLLNAALLWLVICFLRVFSAASTNLIRGLNLGLAGALFAWSVNGVFEFNLGSVQSSVLLWLLVGLGLAGNKNVE